MVLFYCLTGAFICKQKTSAIFSQFFLDRIHVNDKINKLD